MLVTRSMRDCTQGVFLQERLKSWSVMAHQTNIFKQNEKIYMCKILRYISDPRQLERVLRHADGGVT
jgi:hypothetical protein